MMHIRGDHASSKPSSASEPLSAAVLCYPGVSLQDVAQPFHMLTRVERAGHAGYEVALVGPGAGTVRAAGGASLEPDHRLDAQVPEFDVLVVPCGFIASEAFAVEGAVRSLVRAVQRSRRVVLIAHTLQQARRTQMLLREASTWAVGAFWEAVRPAHHPVVTSFIEDGRLIWAIGQSAARDGIARLIGEEHAETATEGCRRMRGRP
jgi:transcriptional regulator GlxA family with amidase domain